MTVSLNYMNYCDFDQSAHLRIFLYAVRIHENMAYGSRHPFGDRTHGTVMAEGLPARTELDQCP